LLFAIVVFVDVAMSLMQRRARGAATAMVLIKTKKMTLVPLHAGRNIGRRRRWFNSQPETIILVSNNTKRFFFSSSSQHRVMDENQEQPQEQAEHHHGQGRAIINRADDDGSLMMKEMQKKKKQAQAFTISRDSQPSKEKATTTKDVSLLALLKQSHEPEIQALPEYRASLAMTEFLHDKVHPNHRRENNILPPTPPVDGYAHEMSTEMIRISLDAALAAFCLHLHARIAALVGKGFYTIGPCGEETLASAALALRPEDSVALHYRHVAINLARQLNEYQAPAGGGGGGQHDDDSSIMEQLLLDRARGYTVSRLDPVTRGVHCSIGSSNGNDYLVTSTLASQCPPAVGRALGYSLAKITLNRNTTTTSHEKGTAAAYDKNHQRPVSLVTVGDGSVHNHHFWSAFQLARHARHKKIKCPVVFGISDNGLSISYSTNGYCDSLFGGNNNNHGRMDDDPLVPLFRVANANDMMEVYSTTRLAMDYARTHSAPCIVLYSGLVRRFGHAATDRQSAYLKEEQIRAMAEMTTLESAMAQAVDVHNATTWSQLLDRFGQIQEWTRLAFERASAEEKVTRQDMLDIVSAKPVAVPRLFSSDITTVSGTMPMARPIDGQARTTREKPQVMRKHMTRVIEEVMEKDKSIVYMGEDVEHGGYYLVTQGMIDKFPGRVIDFPPDETSLLGAAMGFAQVGLVPIVEIPYAKYLDCGADMFYEIAIMNWLSAGQRPNGMVIRLQGFDRGLFGGNFHTHNMLSHMPPGVDVVCYSNGEDYVRGFRHSIAQAKAGRVVMSVDCTDLLNKRHLLGSDRAWERTYPVDTDDDSDSSSMMMGFDDIRCHPGSTSKTTTTMTAGRKQRHVAIVTYGNGVVTALQSRAFLLAKEEQQHYEIDIIDCPYLSGIPHGLKEVLPRYEKVLFADICKGGPGSSVLANTAIALHREGLLPSRSRDWAVVSAPRCYNPLGSTVTFLNVYDIVDAYLKLVQVVES
jgi:pyruvate/2-oxoglutarate/acetoin dehydrogenase E1 component/TPP-dependent pyruvate/acetoin dehydrogenase alpha subunit